MYGNHDAQSQITKRLDLPDNVNVFSARKLETFLLKDIHAALHGQSFQQPSLTENPAIGYPQPVSEVFNIGVLHTALGGMGSHENYAPCSLEDLVNKGYDYRALDHVHQEKVLHERPHIVFPGNLQGRHARETGAKGAYLVTVTDGEISDTAFVSCDVVRWAVVPVSVEEAAGMDEIADRVRQALESAAAEQADGRLLACRVVLEGRTDLHTRLLASQEQVLAEARAAAQEALGEIAEDLEDPVGAFELAVPYADNPADLRFDHAEAVGRLTEIERKIGELETRFKQAEQNEAKLVEEGKLLETKWAALWSASPFDPADPDVMLEWLDARKDVLNKLDARAKAAHSLEAARVEDRNAKERLLKELAALGVNRGAWAESALSDVLERAEDEQSLREKEAQRKTQLQKNIQKTVHDVERGERELDSAEEARRSWRTSWRAAVDSLALSGDAAPEAIEAQIEVIEQMRGKAERIDSLRCDRIDKIHRDVINFETPVAESVQAMAEDLKGLSAEDAVLAIKERFHEANRLQELQQANKKEAKSLAADIDELKKKRRQWGNSVAHLKEAAGVETYEALREAIARSDRRRSLEKEKQATIAQLQQDGDGLMADELEKECAGIDIDRIASRESAIRTELPDLQQRRSDAAGKQSRAREAFQSVGGGDAAARTAADKQKALAEMRETAERYVRTRTAAMLLEWAIDRFRREKQAPLLKRAGEMFAVMTGGSFTGLQVDFDDRDRARLTGLCPDGKPVSVSGLSSGTTDQLYLALRVASIEDYLERAEALPFVADDLFINFDDRRSAAGLRLLEQLAEKTQVLFFTHHLHLVESSTSGRDCPRRARPLRSRYRLGRETVEAAAIPHNFN